MLLTTEVKRETLGAIREDFAIKNQNRSYPQTRHAAFLGIHPSIYSRLLKGDIEKVISEGEWVRIAKKLKVPTITNQWKPAKTRTFRVITAQLKACMENSIGGIFCDDSSLGKTFACETFAASYANVAYVDCSDVSTWGELIRAIARAFGFDTKGTLAEIRRSVIDGIMALERPLIILDEAGDLNDTAWLKLKGLWNALEYLCGWYMTGANGLRSKIENKMAWNKVGFEEMFNRMGNRFQSVTCVESGKKKTAGEIAVIKREQIVLIVKTNAPQLSADQVEEVVNNCDFNARRVRTVLALYLQTKDRPTA